MQPLNVLWAIDHVCYDGSLHGGGRLFMSLAPAFDAREVRIFPYFLRASAEVQEVFADAPLGVVNLNRGKYDPRTIIELALLCRRHAINVMHLFCYAASTFGRIVGTATGVPTIVHDFDTQIYFPYPTYLRLADRLLAAGTGHALAASPMCRDYMRDTRRIPADRITVMPHAISAARFALAEETDHAAARQALGWPADAPAFACVTKLGPDRGNEYMLRAFARVAAERPAARLALVYKPTYYHRVPKEYEGISWIRDTEHMRRELQELVENLGIADRVHLVEQLDDPTLYFAASDALLVPFLNERFSSVHLLEGLAHGRPVIATDLGEQRELLRKQPAGLLVPPGDEAALARAMLQLIDDPEARAAMGAAARRLAGQHSAAANAEFLASLYRDLATNRRAHAAGAAKVRA